MALTEDMLIRIGVDAEDASKSLDKLSKNLKKVDKAGDEVVKTNKDVAASMTGVKINVVAINQALELGAKAYRAIAGPIQQATKLFIEQEKAETKLANTLKILGQFNTAALKDFKQFASGLQEVTVVGDEVTLSLLSIAKAQGLTNEQSKELVKTSADLASATGKGVNESFQQLLKTYGGMAGELAEKLGPAVKDLTAAQLRAGAAVDVVAAKFGGFAAGEAATLGGRVTQMENAFGDLLEKIGELISTIVNLPALIELVTAAFVKMQGGLDVAIAKFKQFKGAVDNVNWGELVVSLRNVTVALLAFVAVKGVKGVFDSFKAVGGIREAIKLMGGLKGQVGLLAGSLRALATGPIALAAKAAALFAGKILLIVAPAIAVAGAIDIIIRNTDRLPELWKLVGNAIEIAMNKIQSVLLESDKFFKKLQIGFANFFKTAALDSLQQDYKNLVQQQKKVEEENKNLISSMGDLSKNIDFGFLGQGVNFIKDMIGGTKEVEENLENSTEKAAELAKQTKTIGDIIKKLNAENLKAELDIAAVGANRIQQIGIQLAAQTNAIEARREELKLAGNLNPIIDGLLTKQAELATAKSMKLIEEEQIAIAERALDVLKGISTQNLSLQFQIDTADITDASDLIEKQLGFNLKAIEVEKEKISINKEFNEQQKAAAIDALSRQGVLMRTLAEQKKVLAEVSKLGSAGKGAFFASSSVIQAASDFGGILNEKLGTSFGSISKETVNSISLGFAKGVDAFGSVMSASFNVLQKFFDPAFIEGLADSLLRIFDKLPQLLTKAFSKLGDVLGKVIEKLPEIVNSLFDNIGPLFGKILDMIPALIDGLADALVSFLDRLPELTARLFDALPGIIDKLLERLPDIITGLLDAIPKIIAQLFKAIPDIIVSILERLPDILESLITGILGAMGEIVGSFVDFLIGGGLEKIVVAFVKAIPKIVVALVKGIVNGLSRAFKGIFKGLSIPDKLEKLPAKFADGVKNLAKKATEESSKLFKLVDLDQGAKSLGADPSKVKDQVGGVIKGLKQVQNGFIKQLLKAWKSVMKVFKKIWDASMKVFDVTIKILKGVWEAAMVIFDGVVRVLKKLWDVSMELFQATVDVLKVVWETAMTLFKSYSEFLKGVWDNVMNAFRATIELLRGVWDIAVGLFKNSIEVLKMAFKPIINLFLGLKDLVKDSFSAIVDFFKNIFKGNIKEAFQGVFDFFKDSFGKIIDLVWKKPIEALQGIGGKIWEGLKEGLGKAGDIFAGFGTKIWDGLKDGLSGLGAFFKDVFDKLNPANLFSKIFKVDYKGKGTVEKALNIDIPFLNFAGGGEVPGKAMLKGDHPKNDTIAAMLSPGEVVVPRSIMQDPQLAMVVKAIMDGSLQFASFGSDLVKKATSTVKTVASGDAGGVIGDISRGDINGALGQIGDALDPNNLWNQVKKLVFEDMLIKMFETNKFHTGGPVGFAQGGEVPAMLQTGEFVVNRKGVGALGLNALTSANQGNNPSNITNNMEITVNIQTEQPIDDNFVNGTLMPQIKDQFKQASLSGEFLISSKGIR